MVSPVVAIRADGSEAMGMGHVMRTLALAEALRDSGAHVVYICADDRALGPIRARRFDAVILHYDARDFSGERMAVCDALVDMRANFVFVDSFFADNEYFETLSSVCPVGSFAFGERFSRGLSLIVSYLFGDNEAWLRANFADKGICLLHGPAYVPLRSEFAYAEKRPIADHVGRLLVQAGGSDPLGMSPLVVDALRRDDFWDDVEVHVVAGPLCSAASALHERADGAGRIYLHESVQDMASLMTSCDIAITARGHSVFELASCGVPMITFSASAEQADFGFLRPFLVYAGDARGNAGGVARECCVLAKNLARSTVARSAMRSAAQEAGIDGLGARRIAEAILAIAGRGV